MTGLSNLERTVFEAMIEARPELAEQLASFVASAEVATRQNTGHGFYTDFVLRRDISPIELPAPLRGPSVNVGVGDEVLGMGFLVWLDGGYPSSLEGFQYGTAEGKDIDLKRNDLLDLRFIGLMR